MTNSAEGDKDRHNTRLVSDVDVWWTEDPPHVTQGNFVSYSPVNIEFSLKHAHPQRAQCDIFTLVKIKVVIKDGT